MAKTNRKPSPLNRAFGYALQINRIAEQHPDNFGVAAPLVIAVFDGDADGWYAYDNEFWREPGFWLARSVRNSPTWGPLLFASIR